MDTGWKNNITFPVLPVVVVSEFFSARSRRANVLLGKASLFSVVERDMYNHYDCDYSHKARHQNIQKPPDEKKNRRKDFNPKNRRFAHTDFSSKRNFHESLSSQRLGVRPKIFFSKWVGWVKTMQQNFFRCPTFPPLEVSEGYSIRCSTAICCSMRS